MDELSIPSTQSISTLDILKRAEDKSLVKSSILESLTFDLDSDSVEGPLLYE